MNCEFLHCDYDGLTVVAMCDTPRRLCPTHARIVNFNGWGIEVEDGKEYVFSPVMLRGWRKEQSVI